MARRAGSLCSLLLLWICAVGAGTGRRSAAQPHVVRGATELALADVAAGPLPVPRPAGPRVVLRPVFPSSHATPGHSFAGVTLVARAETGGGPAGEAILRQATAFRHRPRWRAYDAAAPPALSRLAH